jgi:predicted HTH transcriptional regulator
MDINTRKNDCKADQKGFMKPLLIQVDDSQNEVEANIAKPRDLDGLKEKLAGALQERLAWKMRKD